MSGPHRVELWVSGTRGARRRVVVRVDPVDGALRCDCGEAGCSHLEQARAQLGLGGAPASPAIDREVPFDKGLRRTLVALAEGGLATTDRPTLMALHRRALDEDRPRVARRLAELVQLADRVGDPGAALRAAHLFAELHRGSPRVLERPGSEGTLERIEEARLVEIGRDLRPGAEHGFEEVSYLVDVENGALFREVRRPGVPGPSRRPPFEPFPRRCLVQLGGLHEGPVPRRIELMQYELGPPLEGDDLGQLVALADPQLARVHQRAREGARVAFIRIEAVVTSPRGTQLVLDGGELALHGDPDDFYRAGFEARAARVPVDAVFGRLVVDGAGELRLVPLGLLTLAPGSAGLHGLGR